MTLVLRKSVGPYSAGTAVQLVTQPGKTRDPITVEVGKDNELIDIPADYITELRPRSYVVPTENRRTRRAEMFRALNILRSTKDAEAYKKLYLNNDPYV